MLPILGAHREFIRRSLATCLLLAACDRDAPPANDPPHEAAAQPVVPASPTSSPSPPPLDFEPKRRFSPPLYADFAADVGAEALAGIDVPLGDERERGGRALDDAPTPNHLQSPSPASMPTVITDAELDVGHEGVAILAASGRQPSIRLLGVRIDADGRTDCAKWVSRALRKGQVLVSSDTWGNTRAGSLVLLPDDRIVLNVELLRHGFARLDLQHAEVLRSFPLLVDAAWEALEARTGLAREWHEDEEYVAAVAALR